MFFPQRVEPDKVSIVWAAWGGLDDVVDSQIPMIAAWWLADGLDSDELRELAGLGPSEGYRIRTLLPRVFESLGYGPDWRAKLIADATAGPINEALATVQHDLDAAGLGEYRIGLSEPILGPREVPVFYAAYNGGWSSNTTEVEGSSDELAVVVSSVTCSIQDDLGMGEHIRWPVCAQHDRTLEAKWTSGRVPVWCCKVGEGHQLAEIGQLPEESVKPSS